MENRFKFRGKTIEKKCKFCSNIFYPRVADVNRGWGKFCNKACKAKEQENRTGQFANYTQSHYNNGEIGGTVIKRYEDGTELFYATHFSNEE